MIRMQNTNQHYQTFANHIDNTTCMMYTNHYIIKPQCTRA